MLIGQTNARVYTYWVLFSSWIVRMVPHSKGATHTEGHHTRTEDKLISSCVVARIFSDHFSIVCAHLMSVRVRVSSDDKENFIQIPKANQHWSFPGGSLAVGTHHRPLHWCWRASRPKQYNEGLTSLLDKYAPLGHSMITVRPENFWSTEEIEMAKRNARITERRWQSRRIEIDKQLLRECRNYLTSLCDAAKLTQLSAECCKDQRALFLAVGERLLVKPEAGRWRTGWWWTLEKLIPHRYQQCDLRTHW